VIGVWAGVVYESRWWRAAEHQNRTTAEVEINNRRRAAKGGNAPLNLKIFR
jgi:hypothetical protein